MAATLPMIRLTETNTAVDAVPEMLRLALAAAPVWEKRVLEVGLSWPSMAALSADEPAAPAHPADHVVGDPVGLPADHPADHPAAHSAAHPADHPADQQWAAQRLRVFLLTWDPFEWQPDRPAAFATSTSRSDGAGVVLYVPHWQALAMAGDQPDGLAAVLGSLGQSVVSVAGEQRGAITEGSYAAGVQSGVLPRLLSRVDGPGTLGVPDLTLVGDGWQPIQFDTLEDLAQGAFGPADLDRSPVRFREPGENRPDCPGCAGAAVSFPDGLKDAQETICGPHRAEALRITTARLEASKASNPAGWEALLDAGQRLMEPHLPNALGPRLVAAAQLTDPTPAQLAEQAAMVVDAASLMAGLPDPTTALGGRIAPVLPWLEGLPSALAAAGLTQQAAEVAPAVDELLNASSAAGEAAAAAAAIAAEEAGVAKPQPYVREARVGRNARCPCGSGKKYKFCHGTSR
jgi:hypothetical protein